MDFEISKAGYVTHWLMSGPSCAPYKPRQDLSLSWTDQLGYEKALRGVFYDGELQCEAAENIGFSKPSSLGTPWDFYYSRKNWFVDVSTFYSTLTKVDFRLHTTLVSEKEQVVPATIWTFCAVDLWVNGVKVYSAEAPVYKPIKKIKVELPLNKGENAIFVAVQNLGIRDTRNIFALQVEEGHGLTVRLPIPKETLLDEMETWLDSLECTKNKELFVPKAPPCEAYIQYAGGKIPVTQAGVIPLAKEVVSFTVEVHNQGQVLRRPLEQILNNAPIYLDEKEDHRKAYYEALAKDKNEPRGNGVYFSVFHVLARLACDEWQAEDESLLLQDLDFIESCGDCSDFLVTGFLRLMKNYSLSDKLNARIKEVLLNFRYWMDEPGEDGMCFWSENHALLFHACQLVTGYIYPDEIFTRSKRTGKQQAEIALARCWEWLEDVEQNGLEEFNSANYLPITVVALLTLVDYAPADISARASKLIDTILEQLCLHVFDEVSISPQGRVYRNVIYPYQQTVQSLLYFINPELPFTKTESMWNICYATSKYTFPENLSERMSEPFTGSYTSGNARVILQKTDDYTLTSVCCPREEDMPDWINLCFEKEPDKNSNHYIKSLNERFHGTSVFEPGVYGYQQHLWYAAVSKQGVVFVTHPGSCTDMDSMRPGYWYGNGVFPALKQKENALAMIYNLPDNHPIPFTHAFWPTDIFDEVEIQEHWLFGKARNGYVALWCSGTLVEHNDVLFNCEYRCYDEKVAYYCQCESAEQLSFEEFQNKCLANEPSYNLQANSFSAKNDLQITFEAKENLTQYI